MNTIRRKMIWAGGFFACVLGVAIGARAVDSGSVRVESDGGGNAIILLDDVDPNRLIPLPDAYTVKRKYPDGHPMQNALAGAAESCLFEETKEIYSSKLGTFAFRPGRGVRLADDLITELVRDCTICSLQVRVTGGVENGEGTFRADISLYDACPMDGGQEIPGTLLRFSDLEDGANQFHDLILDYSDRGICDDGSSCLVSQQDCADLSTCVEDPLEIPPTVWLRLRFDTDDAAIVMGSPPTRGFSADAYDTLQGHCTAWFAGWPTFPHATMFAEILAPATCETHFLAYLAANPNRPAFLPSDIGSIPDGPPGPAGDRPPFTTPTTRLGDDIRLTVDNCTLSAYELGMKGNVGEFIMEIDLRWPDEWTIRQDTVATFHGRGEGSAEVGHFTIDEDVNLSIIDRDQPIVITWQSNKANTGAIEVDVTQAGTSLPTMLAFDVDIFNPDTWSIVSDGDFSPAVFYAAIFCRGDAPRGACCPDQPAIPGSDMSCFDDVPVTSCLGSRWQINSTCEQDLFNPPCGTHACCLPTDSCEDRTFDDCVEECIIDEDPIFCGPVCNGGPNHLQPCDPAVGDADCAPNGICDPDASCPGERTCGLTGCQLNGVFTGRPCDLSNPNQGASDCMTCSGSGDYCRPRCVDGLRRGRPCDDHTDCHGSTCDDGFDCPGAQTCNETQSCVHDDGQCSLRCARWGSGEFCGQDEQSCPNFTCFDAIGNCFEVEPEHECNGRCSISRNCTSDSICQPDFGTCLPSGRCSGFECFLDSQCSMHSLGTCTQTDIDCPIGTRCLSEFRLCTGREGCDNLDCCGTVCGIEPACCDNSFGANWDDYCVAIANSNCTQPPRNDDCHSDAPNEGAFDIPLEDDDTGFHCWPSADSCSGAKQANNKFASSDLDDPGFCCNERGVNVRGEGTIWFKFEAMHDTARIHTCRTDGSVTAVNSMIQVFRALEHTDDGSDLDECESLEVIACNDDSGTCGSNGENCPGGLCLAGVCAIGLNVGEIYYIQMAASQGINQGVYKIDIESPCPSGMEPPPGGICEFAVENPLPHDPAGVPFDLSGAELDCPAEPELPGMTNDLWYLAQASCAGNLIVQTCGFDLGEPNPDTTLAVYRTSLPSFSCPPTELVGWNDDATIDPVCSIGGDACQVDEDCKLGCTGLLNMQCESDVDCPGVSTCDHTLRAVCQTVPDGFGDSSETNCLDDTNCNRGVCEDDLVTPCDSSVFGYCMDGSPCDGVVACADASVCESQCGFFPPENRPALCLGQETCVVGHCGSACAPASYVVVPTFVGQWYFVRVGGNSGSEPSGTIRLSCELDDCNFNGVPDGIEIDFGFVQDCNENRVPDLCDLDTGFSNDCNCNEVPDECEIDAGIPVDCGSVPEPCESGPFFCSIDCDPDVNENGIPDCCDAGVPPAGCPDCGPTGACCDGASCTLVTEAECFGQGGLFFGPNSACDEPDADGDGLRDECDGCPDDPNKFEPGICGCGVDDTADSDGDGVPDCADECPGSDDDHCGVPVFKLWVTEVYEVNPDGSYTPKCGVNCPTQDLLPGIAQVRDLINIEVTVEGWDASTDSGSCNPNGEACSVSAQDCANSHCSGTHTSGPCADDDDCFLPDTCDPDICEKTPLLGAYQFVMDSSTYSNGGTGPGLAPAQLPCTSHADCACAYTEIAGAFNDCADFAEVNPPFCTCTGPQAACDEGICGSGAAAYIDSSVVPGYLFFGTNFFASIAVHTLDYEIGAFALDAIPGGVPEELFRCDAGARPICNVDADCPAGTCELAATSPYYLGTILLQATGQSCGLFTIDLIQDLIGGVPVTTFLNDDQATKLPTPIVETLTIDIGGQGEDCNDNGEPDECETDCNQNGTPDDCDVDAGISPDCNNNRTPDECDIASGTSTDVFSGIPFLIGDGIPDECQVSRPARDKHRRAATR